MRGWIDALFGACIADPVFQFSASLAVIAAFVNLVAGRGLYVDRIVIEARLRAGRDAEPSTNAPWVLVSNVALIGSILVLAASVIRHAVFG
jgi:hypothetical protein